MPRALTLTLLPGHLAACRLGPDEPVPTWAGDGPLLSITRTEHELSIVCAAERVPAEVRCERGFRCLEVRGPLAFAETGILASLVTPLAEAGISIFALSTYDSDYLLVPAADLDRALAALAAAGHRVA